MANKQNSQPPQNTSSIDTDLFVKGMTKDAHESFVGKENWSHARNAINNSAKGDAGTIGNEPANLSCIVTNYTIIGSIYLYGDKWILYSTDNTSSEIGLFDDSQCKYDVLVNDTCLNFFKNNLITGASKENFDCSWQVYWDDGRNPSRTLNLGPGDRITENINIPWMQSIADEDADCIVYEDDIPLTLDCEKIRLAPLMKTPCIKLSKSPGGGLLKNGSYQAFLAYTVNEQQIGDYIGVSNIQPLFEHDDTACSLDIEIENIDTNFDFYKLVLLSNNQQQIQGRLVGLYSTEQTKINIDYINEAAATKGQVPFSQLSLRTPAYERSDKMIPLNDYLLRIGPTTQYDFNYQCQANDIRSKWVSVEYPATYYKNGGNKPTFMRDEQYSFFIRFIYSTGEKSSSYHIPGRAPNAFDLGVADGNNALDVNDTFFWQTNNTAVATDFGPFANPTTEDGGVILSKGQMGYWESTEMYPGTDPNGRWCELCGTPIRHHKFPEELTDPTVDRSDPTNQRIRVLGVEFNNITWPRNFDGSLIRNITGYEILVGSRQGNKSIMAKGLLRNMRGYAVPNDGNSGADDATATGVSGVIPNYPFNDLRTDSYLVQTLGGNVSWDGVDNALDTFLNCGDPTRSVIGHGEVIQGGLFGTCHNMYTFHSPETSFKRPYLNPYEIKSYGINGGNQQGHFKESEKHPKHVVLRDFTAIIAAVVGVGYAINQMRGERKETISKTKQVDDGKNPIWGTLPGVPTPGVTAGPIPGVMVFADPLAAGMGGSAGLGTPLISPGAIQTGLASAAGATASLVAEGVNQGSETLLTGSSLTTGPGGGEVIYFNSVQVAEEAAAAATPGHVGPGRTVEFKGTNYKALPNLMAIATSIFTTLNYTAVGGQEVIDLVINLSSPRPHSLKYNSYGLYSQTQQIPGAWVGRNILAQSRYVGNTITDFGSANTVNNIRINNLFRPSTVVLQSTGNQNGIPLTQPAVNADQSRSTLGDIDNALGGTGVVFQSFSQAKFRSGISAHYVGLKFNMDNQYGQLDGIKQIPIQCTQCFTGYNVEIIRTFIPGDNHGDGEWIEEEVISTDLECLNLFDDNGFFVPTANDTFGTEVLFGGDTYLNRYNEKVIMPFYWQFLQNNEPDLFPYNYQNYQNLPYPRHWINFEKFDMINMISPLTAFNFNWQQGGMPSMLHNLDVSGGDTGDADLTTNWGWNLDGATPGTGNAFNFMRHKFAYHYLHNSGVNDFFVESDLNVGLRDHGSKKEERHYDWTDYTDIDGLFHTDIIKEGNYYKYDDSLSKSNLNSQLITYGIIQPRDYDPEVADSCWKYYPKRIIYSNQAFKEAKKDFWRVYLPNNYKDFKNAPTTVKPVSKSGALVLFPYTAPLLFQGVDTLSTDFETKLTIGDGGLFNEPMQQITTADLPHEYGSCENARSAINTPSGVFYMSQAQGKIFNYTQGLTNIADAGLKQWFNKYLPSQLISQFPEIEGTKYADNPVWGIGCQAVYDPNYDIVYFSKKDYSACNPECIEWTEDGPVINETECFGTEQVPACPEGFEMNEDETLCCRDSSAEPIVEDFTAQVPELAVRNRCFERTDFDNGGGPGTSWDPIWPPYGDGSVSTTCAGGLNCPGCVPWDYQLQPNEPACCSTPPGWNICMPGQTPDTQPGFWGINLASSCGLTYIGLTTDHAGWIEGVDQVLLDSVTMAPSPMLGGVTYGGFIDLAKTPSNFDLLQDPNDSDGCPPTGGISLIVNNTTPVAPGCIEMYGSNGVCGTTELLWTSPCIGNAPFPNSNQWYTVPYTLTPTVTYTNLHIRVSGNCPGNPNIPGNLNPSTYMLVDNLVPPGPITAYQCTCPDGMQMVFPDTLAPATQADCLACTNRGEWIDEDPCVICYGQECVDVIYEDVITPVDLEDNEFFTDVSWTVSYDPKIKGWISFHDWHPELTMSSHNHFLTTKTRKNQDPECPPGYEWNPETEMCELDQCPEGYEWNEERGECCLYEYEDPVILYPEDFRPVTIDENIILDKVNIDSPSYTSNPDNNVFFQMDYDTLQGIRKTQPDKFNLTIPFLRDQTLSLSLKRAKSNASKDFKLFTVTQKGTKHVPDASPKSIIYRVDQDNMVGSISFTKFGICGIIQKDEKTYEISRDGYTVNRAKTKEEKNKYVLWDAHDPGKVLQDSIKDFQCPMDDRNPLFTEDHSTPAILPTVRKALSSMSADPFGCLRVAIDVDYYSWQDMDEDNNAVIDWVNSIIDAVNLIYTGNFANVDGSPIEAVLNYEIQLVAIRIWNIEDPYWAPVFQAWNGIWPPYGFEQDLWPLMENDWTSIPELSSTNPGLVSLFTTFKFNGGSIGVACGFGGVCQPFVENEVSQYGAAMNTGMYSVCTNMGTSQTDFDIGEGYQSASLTWATFTPGHEWGHNLGAAHAFICGWEADPAWAFAGGWLDNSQAFGCPWAADGGYPPGTYGSSIENVTIMGYPQACIPACDSNLEFHPVILDQAIWPRMEYMETQYPSCFECDDTFEIIIEGGELIPCDSCKCPAGYDMYFQGTDIPADEEDCISSEPCGIWIECRKQECVPPIRLSESPPEVEASTERGGTWKHNVRCDIFNNYYDIQYPWEIELIESVGQAVNSIRSIEYQMEAYAYTPKYDEEGCLLNYGCEDRWHDRFYNFDDAVIYNSEQSTGQLRLIHEESFGFYNNIDIFPAIFGGLTSILYSKVEQKYRFDGIWDVTANRDANEPIWITQLNGYIKDLNATYHNHFKPELERKKIRHYVNNIFLRRRIRATDDIEDQDLNGIELHRRKMLLKLVNTKLNLSFR